MTGVLELKITRLIERAVRGLLQAYLADRFLVWSLNGRLFFVSYFRFIWLIAHIREVVDGTAAQLVRSFARLPSC